MDYVDHFHREVQAFSAAAREAIADDPAPDVPSCPGWTVTELVLHLGFVHRFVARIFSQRIMERPEVGDWSWLALSAEHVGWLREMLAEREEGHPAGTPRARRPLPAALMDWFGTGAAALEAQFLATPADEPLWTWSAEQAAGFWQRMQTIEAAIHRWDAEGATGTPSAMNADLAVDAIAQTFEVMAPMRRAALHGTPGRGERFRFCRSDGPGAWVVRFDDNTVVLGDSDDPGDVTAAGTASDLMLFLWHRLAPEALDVSGDAALLDRYFELVPPL
jgi:uncharacterized protein (TIGR03083 family)